MESVVLVIFSGAFALSTGQVAYKKVLFRTSCVDPRLLSIVLDGESTTLIFGYVGIRGHRIVFLWWTQDCLWVNAEISTIAERSSMDHNRRGMFALTAGTDIAE